MGTIVRDSIVPYTTARKAGWTDVTFLGSAAVYDLVVGAAQGMDGFYGMGLTEMPYVDSSVASVKKFVEDYKKKFNIDPNIGAVYGYVAADLTVQGLKNAGKDLTLDSFIKGMEAIKGYKDIFNGPPVTLRPQHPPGRELVVPGRGEGRKVDAGDRAARPTSPRARRQGEPGLGNHPGFSLPRTMEIIPDDQAGGGTATLASRSFSCSTGMPAA